MVDSSDKFYNLRFNWRSFISQHPRFYGVWNGFRSPSLILGLSKLSTDLVLEGYPRSGNTFARYAFMMAQPYPLNMAHHSHKPARVIESVKMEIPTLILIRRPKDCVLSYCIYEPRLSIRMGLLHWIRFYFSIEHLKNGYVLSDFDEVVTDFGQVIDKVNNSFGTKFEIFDHNDENVNKIYEQMEIRAKNNPRNFDYLQFMEERISKPSEERDQKKMELEISLNRDKKLLSLLAEAEDLYYSMVEV